MPRSYLFDDTWSVAAPYERVFDLLENLESYPTWWPDVEAVTRVDQDTGLVTIRSVLPYRLRFTVTRKQVDRQLGTIGATMQGDLHGWTRWLLRPHRGGTAVRLQEEASIGRPLLSALEPVLAPAYVVNHALMVRRGRVGLREAASTRR
jgi:uncharacterized protein YndB with AHSA1/START domain